MAAQEKQDSNQPTSPQQHTSNDYFESMQDDLLNAVNEKRTKYNFDFENGNPLSGGPFKWSKPMKIEMQLSVENRSASNSAVLLPDQTPVPLKRHLKLSSNSFVEVEQTPVTSKNQLLFSKKADRLAPADGDRQSVATKADTTAYMSTQANDLLSSRSKDVFFLPQCSSFVSVGSQQALSSRIGGASGFPAKQKELELTPVSAIEEGRESRVSEETANEEEMERKISGLLLRESKAPPPMNEGSALRSKEIKTKTNQYMSGAYKVVNPLSSGHKTQKQVGQIKSEPRVSEKRHLVLGADELDAEDDEIDATGDGILAQKVYTQTKPLKNIKHLNLGSPRRPK